jgi:5-methylcytosine-specific restriction endonuclease McrA
MVVYLFDKELLKIPFDKQQKKIMNEEQYKQYSRYFTQKKYRKDNKDKIKIKDEYFCNECKRLFNRTYQHKHINTPKHKFFAELYEAQQKLKELENK